MNRLLVIAPAWVGDLVMAEPLLRTLKTRSTDTEVDVVAPASTYPLLERIAAVDAAYQLNVGHGELALGSRYRIGRMLRSGEYRQAIVLPNTFKSALIPLWAGVPVRTGWHGESRFGVLTDRRRLDTERYPLMVQRYLALAHPPGESPPEPVSPCLQPNPSNVERLAGQLGLSSGGDVLALCPGAEFGPSKRWPAEHYAAVARSALERGKTVWLIGAGSERAVGDQISELAPGVRNLIGETTLPDAVDLLSLAGAVVSNDSGLMHIACAVGRRVVALFGSSSPEHTPPLSDCATVLREHLDCAPCFARECPLGHGDCLRTLSPGRVEQALGLV